MAHRNLSKYLITTAALTMFAFGVGRFLGVLGQTEPPTPRLQTTQRFPPADSVTDRKMMRSAQPGRSSSSTKAANGELSERDISNSWHRTPVT